MPSRKVRRRRAKLKRHEYEYVIETPEGEEVPVERPGDRERRTNGPGRQPLDRRGRPLPQPTIQRSLRRTAIFAPFIFLFIYITQGDKLTVAGVIFNGLVLLAFFLPFSYFVDRLIYRMLVRRLDRQRGS
jgi:hypothetical protein